MLVAGIRTFSGTGMTHGRLQSHHPVVITARNWVPLPPDASSYDGLPKVRALLYSEGASGREPSTASEGHTQLSDTSDCSSRVCCWIGVNGLPIAMQAVMSE